MCPVDDWPHDPFADPAASKHTGKPAAKTPTPTPKAKTRTRTRSRRKPAAKTPTPKEA
jgi:hypothetical protein